MTFCELWRLYQNEKGSRWDEERIDYVEDFQVYFDDIKYCKVEKTSAKKIEKIFKRNIREDIRLTRCYQDYSKHLAFLNTLLWFYSWRVTPGFRISGLVNLPFVLSEYCKRNRFYTYKNLHLKEQDNLRRHEARKRRAEKRKKKRMDAANKEKSKRNHQKKLEARRLRHYLISAYLGKKATMKKPIGQEEI